MRTPMFEKSACMHDHNIKGMLVPGRTEKNNELKQTQIRMTTATIAVFVTFANFCNWFVTALDFLLNIDNFVLNFAIFP